MKGNRAGMIAGLILAAGMATAVHAADVSCPSGSDVKGAYRALNTVMRQSEGSFFVLTGQPAFSQSGYEWLILTQTQANSFDPAFTSGESDVRSVTAPLSPTAMEMQGVYVCGYFTSSGGMNVMAVAPQQQGVTVHPTKLNLDGLFKFKRQTVSDVAIRLG